MASAAVKPLSQACEHVYENYPRISIAGLRLLIVVVVLFWLREQIKPPHKNRGKNGKIYRFPPGPSGYPIIGNLLQLGQARDDVDHKFQLALRDYGEMATIHLGSKTWVFLNSSRVVTEIIAKRGSITNGRSAYPLASDIVSRKGRSLVLPPAQWAEKRRVMHHLLSGSALKRYAEFQELESTQMLAEYIYKPKHWYRNHYRYANSVVHRIALGERFHMSAQNLANTQRLVAEFTRAITGNIIDWFPILAELPIALQFWRPYWKRIGQFHYDIYRSWWDPVKKKIDEGTAPPSFARDGLLSPEAKFSGDEQEAMYVTMQLVEAGSDTTREALNCFVMSALAYPDKYQKLREEIQRVCGKSAERLPGLTDMKHIPYVHAYAKELLRWRPIFISTPDHMLTQDMEFEGYSFPAGTCFAINEVAVGYECDQPTEFIPERWLNGKEVDITHGLWQFGRGRRICVGYKLAQRSLFLNIARLAYCFDYTPTGPYDSRHVNYDTTGEPFPALPKVRSEEYAKLIMDEAEKLEVLEMAQQEYGEVESWRPEY